MILGLGIPELVVILIIILVIFGPKNLPKIGSALGKTVKNVREGMEEGDDKDGASESPIESHDDSVEVIEDDDDADLPQTPAADASDAVFCSKCGAKNAADAAFCSKCGAPLN